MRQDMLDEASARVLGVNGNMVTGVTEASVAMNEIIYILMVHEDKKKSERRKLKAEVIRIRGQEFDAQVFEDTKDIKAGQPIAFSRELLSIELGPGLLGNVFDGLGNPLPKLALKDGYFLKRGSYLDTIDKETMFSFIPVVKTSEVVTVGQTLGIVKERLFDHRIMVPFSLFGQFIVIEIIEKKSINANEVVARIKNIETKIKYDITMCQKWPVKIPLKAYAERLLPKSPLTTKVRIVDALFPIAEGGTACIPGPFGSGKTVFQQCVSRYGDADVVIVAACGERAGEVVETLREFPELLDPKTGRSLMERTIIICNTSSMPVAAREASVYTAATMGEYYRQMGLRVLLLVDSTSRWAQAVREMSGRLEEIPGEEAFPAYLGSLIAGFYERAGIVRIEDKNLGSTTGSLTLIGTVSPAGGNFEEPVTQSTLAVVGCFLGLTYARSYAKRFPAIAPLDSWSNYLDKMSKEIDERYFDGFVRCIKRLKNYYAQGQAICDQMKVVGEEDVSLNEFVHFLKAEFFDTVFLQQNAFDEVDASPSEKRVAALLKQVSAIIDYDFAFSSKSEARETILRLTSLFRDLNITRSEEKEYAELLREIDIVMKMFSNKELAINFELSAVV
jgi:V/A-type H+/Na+-transporting ATPase subunit A